MYTRVVVVVIVSVESIFTQDMDAFPRMIDTVYQETSRHLLDVLHNKYKFMEHLKVVNYTPVLVYMYHSRAMFSCNIVFN